jgi:hypothetical protein
MIKTKTIKSKYGKVTFDYDTEESKKKTRERVRRFRQRQKAFKDVGIIKEKEIPDTTIQPKRINKRPTWWPKKVRKYQDF